MFGYIRIWKPELKVRESELYDAVYCGLCRQMGARTGCSSRFTLSYDIMFLLLFRMALCETPPAWEKKRCPVHPFQKKQMLQQNPETDYAADAAALLTYYKCRDDLADEVGRKRLRARIFYGTARRMRKRALKNGQVGELDMRISDGMERLTALEKSGEATPDRCAELSGEMLGEIFSFGFAGSEEKIARDVGKHIGKWIYLLDAYDDLLEDRKCGRFNPFLGFAAEDLPELLRVGLLYELSEAEKGMDLLPESVFLPVLQNIIYLGMPGKADSVLQTGGNGGEARGMTEKSDREEAV